MEGSAVLPSTSAPLTPVEAAQRIRRSGIKCSDDTVRRMCERKIFPGALRLHRSAPWQIPAADVDAHIEAIKPKVIRRTRAA
jgi:hypothetical protein